MKTSHHSYLSSQGHGEREDAVKPEAPAPEEAGEADSEAGGTPRQGAPGGNTLQVCKLEY